MSGSYALSLYLNVMPKNRASKAFRHKGRETYNGIYMTIFASKPYWLCLIIGHYHEYLMGF